MTICQFSYNLLQKRPLLLTAKMAKRFETDNYEQKKWSFLPFGFFSQNLVLKKSRISRKIQVKSLWRTLLRLDLLNIKHLQVSPTPIFENCETKTKVRLWNFFLFFNPFLRVFRIFTKYSSNSIDTWRSSYKS